MGRSHPSLAPLLRPGLAVVFIGTEPGEVSLQIGHYYANSSTSFYADLKTTAFTSVQLTPQKDQLLFSYGIGLDDVDYDPEALQNRIEGVCPRAVCFNSKGALERYVGRKLSGEWRGADARKHARLPIKCIVPIGLTPKRTTSRRSWVRGRPRQGREGSGRPPSGCAAG